MSETITLPRSAYEALQERIEDLEDAAILRERQIARALGLTEPGVPFEIVETLAAGRWPFAEWCAIRGIDQTELSARAGVTAADFAAWDAKDREPSLDALRRIARALDVDLDHLVPWPQD